MSSQSKATEDGRDPPDADAPAGRRQRARRRNGYRTTLRVPTALALTARRYADDLGTTPNDALIRLAERGAAIYEGEREVAALAAERRAAVLVGDAFDPDAELSSPEWVEWAIMSAREE